MKLSRKPPHVATHLTRVTHSAIMPLVSVNVPPVSVTVMVTLPAVLVTVWGLCRRALFLQLFPIQYRTVPLLSTVLMCVTLDFFCPYHRCYPIPANKTTMN